MESNRNDARWAAAWSAWVLYFAAVERAAMKSGNPRAPLSHFLRHVMGVNRQPWHRALGQVVAGGAFVWLISHLVTPPKD